MTYNKAMIKFEFVNETKKKIPKTSFKKLSDKFYKVLKKRVDEKLFDRDGQVDLVVISDETIQAMNKEYRNKDKATDVISFAYLEVTEYEQSEGDIIAGDIFVSVDTAAKQAKEKGHTLKKEIEILVVHGLLRCFGFNHRNDKEEKEMEKWAKKVLG